MWVDGHWRQREDYNGVGWIQPGDYDPQKMLPDGAYEPTLSMAQVTSLLHFAIEKGLVPIYLTPEARAEDLRIIHRLLDIVHVSSTPG